MADSRNANTEGSSIGRGKRVGDLHLKIGLGNAVLSKAAILGLYLVASVGEASNAVALLPRLVDLGANFLDDTSIVASNGVAGLGKVLDVLPVLVSTG